MSYRMAPNVECLIVADERGKLHHHYQRPPAGDIARGPIIQYLNDEQRESFLRNRLVEEVDTRDVQEPAAVNADAAVPAPNAELVDECIRDLDRLGVTPTSGAPTARTALRRSGIAYANDVIAAAIRRRKELLAAVPDSLSN